MILSRTLWKINNLFSYIKMGTEILMFSNIEIDINKTYHHKTSIILEDVDIERVFDKISFGEQNYKY